MWFPRHSSLAVLILTLLAAPASSVALTVLTPASAAPGVFALATQFTQQTCIPVTVAGGSRDKTLAALKTGGPVDVVLLPTADIITLSTVTGMTPLGHITVGVGVKAGASVPDVSTPKKFRAVMLATRGTPMPIPGPVPRQALGSTACCPAPTSRSSSACRCRVWR